MPGFSRKEAVKRPFESKPFYPSMEMIHREPPATLKLMDVYKLIEKDNIVTIYGGKK
jgi:hypothetical protein